MKKRTRCVQVTCLCSCYKFPHRIGGGECSGNLWAESYLRIDGEMCQSCICYDEHHKTCDVADGRESMLYCEGFLEHRLRQPSIRLPIAREEEVFNTLLEERFALDFALEMKDSDHAI